MKSCKIAITIDSPTLNGHHKRMDYKNAARPAAARKATGAPVMAALLPVAVAEEATELAELAREEATELTEDISELKELETEDAEADAMLAEEVIAELEDMALLVPDDAAEEAAAETAPKTPPSTESGWLLPLAEEAADL